MKTVRREEGREAAPKEKRERVNLERGNRGI
jgi:hypothetical protein